MQFKSLLISLLTVLFFSLPYAASHRPQVFLKTLEGSENQGKQIVENFCANCHAVKPLIALGAPKIHHNADWESRLKGGLASLVDHTQKGFNAMPPRGGCFECSDEQLLLAILAMLPEDLGKKYALKKGK